MNAVHEPLRLRPLPRPGRPYYERRRRRSSNTAEALELALTHAANRGRLDAVLVVDEQGMLVAKSDTSLDLSMLAAVTPIVGRGKAIPRIRRNGESRDMSVDVLELMGEVLYVAALGGSYRMRAREVAGTIAATKRILA
ncbi:hypothetical protein [Paraliomyxa miuraensis]|uniref:hypothetical protein n=1 Tax=Paraliomyxa miuraensis TaxID=376150 RepID=UPI0022590116|nr:hypothetical protein [Paraliomyxa miuraensis]MCX4240509.1 hypothetical protein [Paraliomyxa miuraensis]